MMIKAVTSVLGALIWTAEGKNLMDLQQTISDEDFSNVPDVLSEIAHILPLSKDEV